MIEFEAMTKRYRLPPRQGAPREVEALTEVTLALPAGSVSAVVGPNGAGKTTLLALLLGFLRPTEGEVRIAGLEPRTYARRHGAAYLPETFRLPASWRVRPAVRALARLEGLGRRGARDRAEQALETVGLAEHGDRPVRTLSRGMLQRLGIAQALVGDRALVVLDEPTEGLDPLWRIRLRQIVGELAAAGRTVVLSSHDLGEVERLAARAVVLDAGRVREVVDLEAPEEPRRYLLEVAARAGAVAVVFPGAEALQVRGSALYRVEAEGPVELSRRLAALLATGAVVASVRPETGPLEERVRRALESAGEAP
jgi:ABC-2 type transport system ATP-binding protein